MPEPQQWLEGEGGQKTHPLEEHQVPKFGAKSPQKIGKRKRERARARGMGRNRCVVPGGASSQNAKDASRGEGKAGIIKPGVEKSSRNPDGAVQNLLVCCG